MSWLNYFSELYLRKVSMKVSPLCQAGFQNVSLNLSCKHWYIHVSPCRRLVFSYRHTPSESIYRHIQGWIDVSITSQACRLCATWSLHTQAVIWLYELWSWSLTGLHSVVVEWPVSLSPISCIRQQRFHFVKLSVTSTRHALEPARHVIWGRVSLLMEVIIEFFHPLLPTSTIWYRSKSLMPCGWKGNRVASHWPCVTNTSVLST